MLRSNLRTHIDNIIKKSKLYYIGDLPQHMIDEKVSIYMLSNIDETKLAIDSSYRLDIALKLKETHIALVEDESISRVLRTAIDDGFKFTSLEITAIEKIFTIINCKADSTDDYKPVGYDIAVNVTMLSSLCRCLTDQRTKGFDTMTLTKIKPVELHQSYTAEREIDTLLTNNSINVYLNVLKLYLELLRNIKSRYSSGKY